MWESTHQVNFPQVSHCRQCSCLHILIPHITKVLELDSVPLVMLDFYILVDDVQKWCCYLPVSLIIFILVRCYIWFYWNFSDLVYTFHSLFILDHVGDLDNHKYLQSQSKSFCDPMKYMLYTVFIYMYIHPVWALYFFKTGLKRYFKCWHLCKTLLILNFFFFFPAQLTR